MFTRSARARAVLPETEEGACACPAVDKSSRSRCSKPRLLPCSHGSTNFHPTQHSSSTRTCNMCCTADQEEGSQLVCRSLVPASSTLAPDQEEGSQLAYRSTMLQPKDGWQVTNRNNLSYQPKMEIFNSLHKGGQKYPFVPGHSSGVAYLTL